MKSAINYGSLIQLWFDLHISLCLTTPNHFNASGVPPSLAEDTVPLADIQLILPCFLAYTGTALYPCILSKIVSIQPLHHTGQSLVVD